MVGFLVFRSYWLYDYKNRPPTHGFERSYAETAAGHGRMTLPLATAKNGGLPSWPLNR